MQAENLTSVIPPSSPYFLLHLSLCIWIRGVTKIKKMKAIGGGDSATWYEYKVQLIMIVYSYTLSREYRVVKRLFFTSEYRQMACTRTLDGYDVTMPVHHVRVTSQLNCEYVTMLSQKKNAVSDNC